MALYDDFRTGTLNSELWVPGEMRDGETLIWRWIDPALSTAVKDGRLELNIERFSQGHDQVQIFDNPKALYFSTKMWDLGDQPLSFRAKLAAEFTGDLEDYRNGFASFNVIDFNTGTVMDIVANGRKLWSITERLDIPGQESEVAPFGEFKDLEVSTAPGQEHDVEVVYDPREREVSYRVDGAERHRRELLMDPRQLFVAMGLITLYPIEDGKSVSCRGQGGRGLWGEIAVKEIEN